MSSAVLKGTQDTISCISRDGEIWNDTYVCERVPVTCDDGKEGEAIGRCKAGKCIATESCGKPLSGLPDVPVDGAGSGSGTAQPAPLPTTLPTSGSPFTLPPPTDGSGSAAGGTGGGAINPTPLPAPTPTPPSTPAAPGTKPAGSSSGAGGTGGTTFMPISVNTVSPGTSPSGSTLAHPAYTGGVFSDGNPFYAGSTFGGSYGGISSSGGVGGTLIGSAVSLFTNFFLGQLFSGSAVGGSGVTSPTGTTVLTSNSGPPTPAQNVQTQKPVVRTDFKQVYIGDDRLAASKKPDGSYEYVLVRPDGSTRPASKEEVDAAFAAITRGAAEKTQPISLSDASAEVSDVYKKNIGDTTIPPLQQQGNNNRESTNVEDRRNDPPLDLGGPNWSLLDNVPKGGTQPLADVYRFVGAADGKTDLPLNVPEWWTPALSNGFAAEVQAGYTPGEAYARARTNAIEGAFAGLADGRLAPGSAEVDAAKKLLEENLAIAKQERDRAYDAAPIGFYKLLDRVVSVSPGQIAVDRAEARLTELVQQEGYARLGMYAGTYEAPVTAPNDTSLVKIVDTPIVLGTGRTFDLFDPRTWLRGGGGALTDSAVTPHTPQAQNTSPSAPPASSLLSGLSAVASRVAWAVQTTVRSALGLPLPQVETPPGTSIANSASEPDATPTPPVPSPNPSRARDISALLLRPVQTGSLFGSINWWTVLMGGVRGAILGLLTPSTSSTASNVSVPQVPQSAENAAAFITAAPSHVSAGSTTRLAWSSTGTSICAVVDAELVVIAAGGQKGVTSSPPITATTRFGVICNALGGHDKVLNETLVVVEGSTSTPAQLFSDAGRASKATGGTSGSFTVTSGTGATAGNPKPVDVRTCDPQLPIDVFIQCLCVAEPNPAGCSLVR